MKVNAMEARPVKQKDGTWTVVIRKFEKNIPDKGRHSIICNKCTGTSYPQCREWCPIEKPVK